MTQSKYYDCRKVHFLVNSQLTWWCEYHADEDAWTVEAPEGRLNDTDENISPDVFLHELLKDREAGEGLNRHDVITVEYHS